MKTFITKQFKFEAAHSLPSHDGKCKNLHGHSYMLEVTVSGEIVQGGAKDGMVMDFADLSEIIEGEIISQWDHQFLNNILPFTTTVENLAAECFKRIKTKGVDVTKVKLWETAKSFVEVCED